MQVRATFADTLTDTTSIFEHAPGTTGKARTRGFLVDMALQSANVRNMRNLPGVHGFIRDIVKNSVCRSARQRHVDGPSGRE